LQDLLDGGYWRPRSTFDTAEGGERERQERAEAEVDDRDELTIVREQKRQRREEKGKERVKESQDISRDVATEVNAALHAATGSSTGPEAELSEGDSQDESDTDRGRSQSTHATTSGEKVAVKYIDGGLDGDYWKVCGYLPLYLPARCAD
jgi:hypothetical protein